MSLSCCVVCTTKLQDRQAAKVGRDDLRLSSKSSCEQKLNMFCLQYLQFMFFFCFLRNSLRNLSLVFVPRSSCDFEVARCFSFFPFDVILAKFLDLFFFVCSATRHLLKRSCDSLFRFGEIHIDRGGKKEII